MASLKYLEGEILFHEYKKTLPKGWHCHHIIPRYRCKQLGIDPNFYENLVGLPPEEHILAHKERYNRLGEEGDWYAVRLLSLSDSLAPNPRKGKPGKRPSQETRKKLSEAKIGTTLSAETKKKISETLSGRTLSAEHKKKTIEGLIGRPVSAETRKKISESGKMGWIKRKEKYGASGNKVQSN